MDCWEILHIAPTGDERAIRRAYAKLLKSTRPDDDAEGYQRLREAFDEALSHAPYIDEEEDADDWSWDNADNDEANVSDDPDEAQTEYVDESVAETEWAETGGFNDAAAEYESTQAYPYNEWKDAETDYLEETDVSDDPYEYSGATADAYSFNEYDGVDSDYILAEIGRIHDEGKSEALEHSWHDIRALLDRLPLGESEYIAWDFLDFLRERHISNIVVWAQWASYFRWHESREVLHRMNTDELEWVYDCINAAEVLSDNANGKFPLLQSLNRLIKQGRDMRALANAFFLNTALQEEMPPSVRMALMRRNDKLTSVLQKAQSWRQMRIVLPIVAIFVAMFTAAADDALSAYIEAYYSLALVSTLTLALLCFLIDTCRSILYTWLPFLHKILTATFVFKKAAIVRAFVLPVVMTAVCLFWSDSVMFFLLTVLAWIYSWCTFFSYIKSERSIVGGLTVNLSLMSMFPIINVINKHLEQTAGNSVLLILTALMILLWFNANLYLRAFHRDLSQKQAQFLLAPCSPNASFPIRAVASFASALVWMLTLPQRCADYTERDDIWTPLGFGVLACMLTLILPLGGNRMLWFYPIAFALGWLMLVLKQNAYRSLMRA